MCGVSAIVMGGVLCRAQPQRWAETLSVHLCRLELESAVPLVLFPEAQRAVLARKAAAAVCAGVELKFTAVCAGVDAVKVECEGSLNNMRHLSFYF